LTVFLRDRWNTGTLMAYVKTGFAGLTDHQGFALENYCLARGVQRMHWESRRPWRFTPSDEEGHSQADRYMERLRQKLWRPLERLRMELTGASTVEEAAAAVCRHLYSLKADEMCCRLAKEALERGEPEAAQIHLRAWQELMKLFDQTVLFLALPEGSGEEDLPQLLASVWESGLEVAEMATLPPALDQVTICSMDRSRSPMAEKVWILGANEGVIPASMKQDNLLDAGERQWLASRQIHLAPDNRRRTFSEYYLIYIALTRASKSLNISCARADIQGGSQAPSVLLEQLCRWFPGLTVDESELPVTRRLNHPRAGLQLLGLALQEAEAAGEEAEKPEGVGRQEAVDAPEGAGALGGAGKQAVEGWPGEAGMQGRADWAGRLEEAGSLEEVGMLGRLEGAGAPGGGGNPADRITESLWRYVFRWFAGNRAYDRDIQRLKAAYDLSPLGQPLPAALAEALFGRTIKTSVTRLEQYQACPFAHFLAYGLSLEPREEYAVEPPEIGNYFHDSLEALMGEVKSRGLALGALSRQEREELVEKVAAGQLDKKSHEIFLTSAWYRRLSNNLRRILQSSAGIMAYQENQGSFLSDAFEVAFGFDDMGGAPPISLDLGEGRQILLRGRIDRIDQATRYGEEAGERFLRVVDYKSGGMTLALHEIYYGLKLQLILYMEAALTAVPGAKPAGLFYFQIHDPILQAANVLEAGDEAWRMEKMLKTRAFRGYMLGDREVASLMDKDYEKSLFLPVSVLKSGDFSRHAKVLSGREFALLGDYSRRVLNKAGQGIMEGDISLSPYRMGKKTACDFCPYPSVCRFDPVIRGHSFRYLPVLSDAVVRERLAAGAGGETGFSAGARRGSILPDMHGGGGSTPQGGGGK
jgi:ATP-dependent helicase/DNAse subunit B